ncbi:MAG: AraC family transcriptional regulator [Kiritimatiellae bacterium]|nr:AraC family transcriptional regulator [Kiritimatiellia bacterium]
MAGRQADISKRLPTTAEIERPRVIQCILLSGFVSRRPAARWLTPHNHPYWQLEAVAGGKRGPTVYAGGEVFTLRHGDAIVIPPDVAHRLQHSDEGSYMATFKFRVHGLAGDRPTAVLPRSERTVALLRALTAILPEKAFPSSGDAALLEHILGAYMHVYAGLGEGGSAGARRSPAERVKARVAALRGKPIAIRALAKDLGYSTSHLSVQFHRSEGVTLKAWLDWQRAAVAARLLRYGDLSISETAYQMGFSNPFAFSRFCKRTLGMSPRSFRAEIGGA